MHRKTPNRIGGMLKEHNIKKFVEAKKRLAQSVKFQRLMAKFN
jgi:hypothetical protein